MQTTSFWIALLLAGFLEVIWVIFLKQTQGFTKFFPSMMFLLTAIASMWLLAYAMRVIPISLAYPIWTGIGAVGSVLVGLFFFGETLSWIQGLFLCFVVTGIIGLKIFS